MGNEIEAHLDTWSKSHTWVLGLSYTCVPGLSRVMPQPPPPAPVSLLWRPRARVTLQRMSREGWPTPITFRWC